MDYLADLNEPQRRAVVHRDGPLLVLAGAGSGKTRVITRRVAHLIAEGVAPWNVLALTFTNKAAREMVERVAALGMPSGATIGTFHALCARLLREFAVEAGLDAGYSIYDREDQLRLTRQALDKAGLKGSLQPGAVHARISNVKNELKTPEQFAAEAETLADGRAAEVYHVYQELLGENNALDFDDLLLRTALLLRDRPNVRELLGRRYRYVLIDEYQDTNHAQYIIAHGIAMDHENICATGDPDQSIYAWRGANIRNILEFEADYPDCTVVRLEENYRSTPAILNAASRLIACNRRRKRKNLWTQRRPGPDVHVLRCDDARAEARTVAERIDRAHRRGVDYGDMAVFYRVNSLSRVLEETLFRSSVPYRVARGVEFFNRKEVKDVLAYLKVLVNPADDLSCRRIINTPTRGIGRTTLERLEAVADGAGLSLLDAAERAGTDELGGAAGRVRGFAGMIRGLGGAPDRPVRDIVEDVYRRSGMEEALSGDDEERRQQRSNIEELINTAAEFDEVAGGTLSDYLYQVSLVSDLDHFEGTGGAVTLMTLHAAKGLEFPLVFVVGCEDGLLPFRRDFAPGDSDATDVEEERRLLFVGMTRAKDELTLSCARQRRMRGKTKPQAASKFLGEIGTDGVTVEDLTTAARRPQRRSRTPGRAGGFFAGGEATDADEERAIIEAMADAETHAPPPPEYQYITPGSRVHHPKYGPGRVMQVSCSWPETRAEIVFDESGPKTIVLRSVELELLEG
ncbi:MAG: ATP-dependent helicase [Planctomycetota bacterium]